MSRTLLRQWLAVALTAAVIVPLLLISGMSFARGGAYVSRGAARTSVNRSVSTVNRNVSANVNRDVNRNVNVDRNVNVHRDIDFDRDVDVDVDHHYGGWGYGCCYHPAATAAAATAAAVTTAAVVGSVVNTLPASCQAVSANGLTYQRCGSTWYQPQFVGTSVNYIVVNPPR